MPKPQIEYRGSASGAIGHLASVPFEFEVREPDILRAAVVRVGERLMRLAGAAP